MKTTAKKTKQEKELKGEILVIEDEKPLARALELKLARSGFLPTVTYNGEDALTLIAKKKYCVILLDLILPKTDGFTVLTAIRKKDHDVPIIVSTNLSQAEDEKRAMKLGANSYFVKADTPIAEVIQNVEKLAK